MPHCENSQVMMMSLGIVTPYMKFMNVLYFTY